jgi:hypothetical protein
MKKVSLSYLAKKSGMIRRTVKKWLDLEGLEPPYDEKEALKVLASHKQGTARQENKNVDPDSGLTWAQKKMREDAKARERENEIAEALKSETYLTWDNHHKIITGTMQKIEQALAKFKATFGLSDAQMLQANRLIDEARMEAAATIKQMR